MRILASFIVALSLLLAGSTYTYRTTMQASAAAEWMAQRDWAVINRLPV
jgi:hypothetical protein